MSRRLRALLGSAGEPPGATGGTARHRGEGVLEAAVQDRGGHRPDPDGDEPLPGPLLLDLIAAVLAGGASPVAALRAVAAALDGARDPRADDLRAIAGQLAFPTGSGSDPAAVDRLLALAEDELLLATASGLPPAELLRRAAIEERRRAAAAQRRAVHRLEVLLVLPAGLCLLPAFVLLGIVPVVLAIVRG